MGFDLSTFYAGCPRNDGGILIHCGSSAYPWRCQTCGLQFELVSGTSTTRSGAIDSFLPVRDELAVSLIEFLED